MCENKTIIQVIYEIYCHDNIEGWECSSDSLYEYVNNKFKDFEASIGQIKENEFNSRPEDVVFNGEYTKKRMQNLIHIIVDSYRLILRTCYKGDLYKAYSLLNDLLIGKETSKYLVEWYINYFFPYWHQTKTFYRLREEAIGIEVQDCLHVPYDKRENANQNRFSIQGLPCFYLSDSIETAFAESATEAQDKVKWIGEFTEKQGKNLAFMDLRFTSVRDIDKMSEYERLTLLITYPIRLLCSLKTKHRKEKAHDEYMIPQLFSHIVLIHLKENPNQELFSGYDGFVYDSQKREGGLNFIIPARYTSKEPPTKGHSEIIKEMFDMKKPYIV